MGLIPQERLRLTGAWRRFVADCLAAARNPELAAALKPGDPTQWASPLDRREDAFVLFALARLADAYARAHVSTLPMRAPSLQELAELAGALLGPEPEPPALPFRADLDG